MCHAVSSVCMSPVYVLGYTVTPERELCHACALNLPHLGERLMLLGASKTLASVFLVNALFASTANPTHDFLFLDPVCTVKLLHQDTEAMQRLRKWKDAASSPICNDVQTILKYWYINQNTDLQYQRFHSPESILTSKVTRLSRGLLKWYAVDGNYFFLCLVNCGRLRSVRRCCLDKTDICGGGPWYCTQELSRYKGRKCAQRQLLNCTS